VGLLDTLDDLIGDTIRDGHVLLMVGETRGHLGQSALLYEVFKREDGDAPAVDLQAERRNGEFIRANRHWINACTDLSDGGLALAAFEMAVAGGVGLTLEAADTATLFGEDQGRYLIATNFDKAEALMVAAGHAGVSLVSVGKVGGDMVRIGAAQAPLEDLAAMWKGAFAEIFG